MIRILFFIGCVCGIIPVAANDSFNPQTQLQGLVARSDLIIVATPQTAGGSYGGSGSWVKPGEDKEVPRYEEFLPQLKVEQVLKGNVDKDKILWISYTTIVMQNGKYLKTIDPHGPPVVVKLTPEQLSDEKSLPGSPQKGTSYVFFLENRKMHDPGSYEAAGTNEIIYRNFDYHFGIEPASDPLIEQVKELARLSQS